MLFSYARLAEIWLSISYRCDPEYDIDWLTTIITMVALGCNSNNWVYYRLAWLLVYDAYITLKYKYTHSRQISVDDGCMRLLGRFAGHYNDVIMTVILSQITSLTSVYSTVYSDADQRKHLSAASLAFVRGIHRGPVNSTHIWPVTEKLFPYDDVIMGMNSQMISRKSSLPSRASYRVSIPSTIKKNNQI